jgi:CSLREA domain-containing protein
MTRAFCRFPLRLVILLVATVLLAGAGSAAMASPADPQPDVPAVTFTVNSTDDFPDLLLNGVCATAFGTCTLRAAIQEVNNYGFASGPHNIHFNITGAGPHTILVYSELPRLERAVVIDGTTDGGTCPTSSVPANIKIVIDGTNVPTVFSDGLNLWRNASAPSGSTIRGIAIGGFGYGIWLDGDGHTVECSHIGVTADGVTSLQNKEAGVLVWQGSSNTVGGTSYADRNVISGNSPGGDGVRVDNASNTTIQGNYIGTSSAGTLDVGNSAGVRVVDSANTVIIGGTGSAQRNLLSGNLYGIVIDGNDVDVVNNFIGTHVSGTSALANSYGIQVWENANDVTIGGGLVTEGNLISGNSSHGIYIDAADGVTILNNKIGVQLNGTSALGNGGKGIYLDGNILNTRIGQPNDGNTIAFNEVGIWHYYCCGYQGFSTHGNSFRANSIHSNTDLGIDLAGNASGGVTINDGAGDADTGPNDFQNYPGLIFARNSGYMYGLLVTRGGIDYTVDFYENETCDDSGYGEGKTYLGSINVTTDALGYAIIDTTLSSAPALGHYVVTTATASDESTSEFSLCTLVTQTTFVVDSTADAGDQTPGDGACDITGASTDCTLRAAIQEVNALGGGPYVIEFDLGTGGGTVRPASALPNITVPVVIDGVTAQDGAYCGSDSGPAVLNVVLKGDLTTNVDGLHLAAGSNGSSIKGLVINEFDGHGIRVSSNNNDITCNFIGVGQAGAAVQPNGLDGVHVTGNNNRIGGDSAALRNVMSGNLGSGVEIAGAGATGNKVKGNVIGLAAGGGAALGNGASGVEIDAAINSVIGGNSPVEGNIISANGEHGVRIHNGATGNAVRGNTIGLNEAGAADRGNANSGVLLDNAPDNFVGGINPDYGNLIAGNSANGVLVQGGSSSNNIRYNRIGLDANGGAMPNDGAGVRFNQSSDNRVTDNTIKYNAQGGVLVLTNGQMNRIRTNSISQNTGLGIDLNNDGVTLNDGAGDPDTGGNGLQNFPVITEIDFVAGTVDAVLISTTNMPFTVDFFSSPQCDASGYGEGETFLGTYMGTSDGSGILSFTHPLAGLADGEYLTAVATDANNNSSEFSSCVEIVGCPDPDVDNDNDVDVTDITLVANRWNNPGSYDPAYDLDCSGAIDIKDVMLVSAAFGT